MGSISRAGRITIANLSKLAEFTNRNRKILVAASLWLVILVTLRTTMAVYNLTLTEIADGFAFALKNTSYGMLLYVLLYVVRPLLLMPGTLMNFLAGMVYGFPLGLVMVIIAHLLSATITYALSRWVTPQEPHFDGQTEKLASFVRRNPFEAMMSLQLMYVSLDFASSLAGILHLPYRLFILGIFIGGFVGNGLGVFIGSSLQGSIGDGAITIQPEIIAVSVTVFIVSMGISALLRRRHRDVVL